MITKIIVLHNEVSFFREPKVDSFFAVRESLHVICFIVVGEN